MPRETLTGSQVESQAERILAKVRIGAADPADVAAVVSQPESTTPYGWFSSWVERAGQTRLVAREALVGGDSKRAASCYLRASEYFRAAASVYWPVRGNAAVADAIRLHSECFRASLDIDGPVYRQFSNAWSGYLARPRRISADTGLLICLGPADGTAAEQYLLAGHPALELGWGVALIEPAAHDAAAPPSQSAAFIDQITAEFTAFAGIEPMHRTIACIGAESGRSRDTTRDDPALDVIWLTLPSPEIEQLQRRIRAPGSRAAPEDPSVPKEISRTALVALEATQALNSNGGW